MKAYGWIVASIFCISSVIFCGERAGVVIFSKDRPMQLYALLESMYLWCSNIGTVVVIYHAVDDEYEVGYQTVRRDFPQAVYLVQSRENPRSDFKKLFLCALEQLPERYVLLGVDDIVVKDECDCTEMIRLLEQTGAYGFYLRFGENVIECLLANGAAQSVPAHAYITPSVLSWRFCDGILDWAYPNSVDMTLVRKEQILDDAQKLHYTTPNTFEGSWFNYCNPGKDARGLCYVFSKIVNVPVNMVQQDWSNPITNRHTAHDLAVKFNAGYKIDVHALYGFKNRSPHNDVEFKFTKRGCSNAKKGMLSRK